MARLGVRWTAILALFFVSVGCAGHRELDRRKVRQPLPANFAEQQPDTKRQGKPAPPEISDWGWRERIITEEELNSQEMKDPALTPAVSHWILARLNSKASFHIFDDIRKGKPLKVPIDLRAYLNWTPLPRTMQNLSNLPKSILVVKDLAFLGWYENGKLVGDTQAGLGMQGKETAAGVYKISEKVADHYSRSYRNDLGEPAWMPWAMKIYGGVWIHAGDVSGPYCSHGCVMLPMNTAEELFHWADLNTTVVIVESLR